MRAKYQIMRQTKGGEARVLFTSTRKYDTERYFNGLRRDYKKIKSNAVCDAEYWICKA